MQTMTELNVLLDYDLENDLENQDDETLISEFFDYSGSEYIGDAISQISDDNVSFCNKEILENAWNLYANDSYENASSEGLMGEGNDLIKNLQSAWYYYNEQQLYNNLEILVYNYAVKYIAEQNVLILNDDFFDKLQNELSDIDSGSRFDDIIDIVDELIDQNNILCYN